MSGNGRLVKFLGKSGGPSITDAPNPATTGPSVTSAPGIPATSVNSQPPSPLVPVLIDTAIDGIRQAITKQSATPPTPSGFDKADPSPLKANCEGRIKKISVLTTVVEGEQREVFKMGLNSFDENTYVE